MSQPHPDREGHENLDSLDVVPGGLAPVAPGDEAERLADLRALGILESGVDPDLDSLVDLAALVAGVPIALLSIVEEDEQVFKCAIGLDADRMPRDVSFCGHAILSGREPMIIPDARDDHRFAGNPIVTGEPRVVFYAGVPLLTSAGHAIGTLCVIDHEPRQLTERQVAALVRLAGQASGLIEARAPESSARRRAVGMREDATGLPLREGLIAEVTRQGGLPRLASALALRVEEIDASVAGGGLLADGALRARYRGR